MAVGTNLNGRQLRRLGSRRLSTTIRANKGWTSRLKLCNLNSAIKPELVNTVKSDAQIRADALTRFGFNARVKQNPHKKDRTRVPQVCHIKHAGLCNDTIHFDKWDMAAQNIRTQLFLGNHLRLGTCMAIQISAAKEYHLIGHIVERPVAMCFVTLYEEVPEQEGICLRPATILGGPKPHPRISTLQEAMSRMMSSLPIAEPAPNAMHLIIFEKTMSCSGGEVPMWKATEKQRYEIGLKEKMKRPKRKRSKKQATLPFGLQLPPKAKKKIARPSGKKDEKDKTHVAPKKAAPKKSAPEEAVLSSSSSSSSSSSESSSSSGSSSGSDSSASSGALLSKNAETELVEAIEEEKAVAGVEVLQAQPSLPRRSTYFHTDLGILDVERANTNRSKCNLCMTAIAKDSMRAIYAYDPGRPEAYIHPTCAGGIRDNLKAASITNIRKLRANTIFGDMIQACEEILAALA